MSEEYLGDNGFEEICNNIEDNVFVHSVSGICLYANKKLTEALNKDIRGMDLFQIFPHKSEEYIDNTIKKYKEIRESKTGYEEPEQTQILPNGEERVYSVTKTPILRKGTPAIAGIGKDITPITNAKKKVEEINAALSKFINHAIHDVKNPAGAIEGYTSLMVEKIGEIEGNIDSPEKIKKNIETIKRYLEVILISSNKISNFAKTLNDFQKIKETKAEINVINTNNFFKQLYEQQYGFLCNINKEAIKKDLPQKNIKIVLDASLEKLPPIFQSDEQMLDRIFSNLIGNSVKFTKEGSITISCSKNEESEKNNYYTFTIRDTGIGIDPQHHKRIFKEFESVHDDNDKLVSRGSGLGLASVTEILKLLKGNILPIESELGKGTAISFEIPIDTIS